MIGKTSGRFWKHFESLPANVQKLAREKYELWKSDPHHPPLGFEERRNGICVVRVGNHYRDLRSAKVTSSPGSGSERTKNTTASGSDFEQARQRLIRAVTAAEQGPGSPTKRSLIEIGLDVGYKNPSHFAQVFRRVVGITPREFRSAL